MSRLGRLTGFLRLTNLRSLRKHPLRAALADLPEGDREMLLLIAWEQLTPTEAAAVVGIGAGTARTRLHRARARMRAALEAHHPPDADDEPDPARFPSPLFARPTSGGPR